MTLSVATVQPAAALPTASVGSVGSVTGAGPVQAPVSVPSNGSAPAPQDGVDRIPHADIILKDVLAHASQRLTGPLPPLRTPQAQLALAQHREFGSPFPGLAAGLGAPGGEAAKPGSTAPAGPAMPAAAAEAPAIGPPVAPPSPAPGQPAPAAGPPAAQGQPLQQPVAAPAPASPPVNPNPPPPPNAAPARQQRRRERWRPRDPQGKNESDDRDTRERDRSP